MTDIVGILLAAGQSTRFGQENKLLAPLKDGTPLIIAAARPLQAALSRVIVVMPSSGSLIQELLKDAELELITCPESSKGMGASIACGVRASREASGWLIALGDMPDIPAELVQKVASGLEAGIPLLRPMHEHRPGHPVGFSHSFRDELLSLHDDTGGQNILNRHISLLHYIQTSNRGALRDIDTKSTLREH